MRRRAVLAALALVGVAWPTVWTAPAEAALPTGFAEQVTHRGLNLPTAFDFAPDGTLFVAEKRGVVKVFDGVQDTTPTVFADLRTQVHNVDDRGMVGLLVDPAWPARPYVYVHYAYDAPVGGTAPTYGTAGTDSDACPRPGGVANCPASVRVSRLVASGGVMAAEVPLVRDVCHQFPMHDGGGLAVGPEGALYVSVGEGAWWNGADHGNWYGNPCGDPPGPPGADLAPPSAEGGALRSQDLRTTGDPGSVNGSVLRIDPDTGAPWPTNPLIDSADPESRKVLAHGLRNPYRIDLRPGTDEVWVADVGQFLAEEIDRIAPAAPVENFGWPCYEGRTRNPGFDALDLTSCETLYAQGATAPHHSYCHGPQPADPNAPCPSQVAAAISGLTFYGGGTYPDRYDGALFFADYTQNTIWAMLPGTDGVPDPARVETFASGIGGPVDLRTGPGGDLFYVDVFDGSLRRIFVGVPGVPPDPPALRPTATIATPAATTLWSAGGTVSFSGRATDHTGAPLPASALSWSLNLLHCYTDTDCHRHPVGQFPGVASGSAVAPDHEYPAKLELTLTATNAVGVSDTTSVVLQPRTVDLTFSTTPAGLQLSAGNTVAPGPFTRRFIVGGAVALAAPASQTRQDGTWEFRSWSDGGARNHTVVAGASPATYTATYALPGSK